MKLRTLLLAGTALIAFSASALADNASVESRLDALQKLIENQQAQIEAQRSEITNLKKALGGKKGKAPSPASSVAVAPPPPSPQAAPAVETKLAEQQAQIDTLTQQLEADENSARLAKQEAPTVSMAGGRPTFTSADGRFSLAIRSLVQYDLAHYMQPGKAQSLAAANGPDLSSGGNFRRAWFGVQGKVFGDWSYYLNYDFGGGGGTETPGHVQQLWVQYDGLGPIALRIGAFTPSNGIEDATSSGDTIFLERNAVAEMARNIAGGDGRNTISATYSADKLFAQITYTGNKIQDSGAFDEQQAVTGRLAGLPFSNDSTKLLLSAAGSYVFKVADAAAGQGAARTITLNAPPEITVDNTGTKFVTSGSLNAERVWQYGLEAAAEWQSLYTQAGYFRYGVDLRANAGAYGFGGWYGQASYLLTGESRPYSAATASFGNPKPRIPFSLSGGGWGAWEVAARYSDLDLNDHAGMKGAALPTGGLRGGEQKAWTLGVNWYPNQALKFEAQYQNVGIDRLGTIPAAGTKPAVNNAFVGQSLNIIALRSQIAF
ncbi:phosphate-selective porin OprO/OprP [Rhizomicrobium palustre]|uniref:Phosphate-selective porin OprO/OprP n=1 Tax=Rhizomicrobium palustre TaxID=189966 RepID=A0A846N2A0_9PROT|nr:porin [Rhizomicrobium palustre]NIK90068.1 phosphate-selective porin OprO/OprP [Rhizomicrobium palustre]